MQSISKGIITYLNSFNDNDFHELNEFLKSNFSNTNLELIRSEITRMSDKKKIDVVGNSHSRWTLHTPNIHPEHNVVADLDNWIVRAKIHNDYREILESEELEAQKNKGNEELQKLQMEVLALEKEELKLKKENKELNEKYAESQQQLTQLQIKELKEKRKWAIWGAIGSALLTLLIEHLTDIPKLLHRLFQ